MDTEASGERGAAHGDEPPDAITPGGDARAKRRRRRLWWLALLVAAGAMYAGWRIHIDGQIAAERAVAAARGYPLDVEGFEAWYREANRIPDGATNAADRYLAAFGAYVAPDDAAFDGRIDEALAQRLPDVGKDVDWPSPFEPIDDETLAAMRAHLDVNAPCLRLLREATGAPCRYPLERRGMSDCTVFNDRQLDGLHGCVRLCYTEVVWRTSTDGATGALRAFADLVALTHTLDHPSGMIDGLVRSSCETNVVDAAEAIVNRCELTDAQLAHLDAALAGVADPSLMRDAMAGDLVRFLAIYRDASWLYDDEREDQDGRGKRTMRVALALGMLKPDELQALRTMNEQAQAMSLSGVERLDAMAVIDRQLKQSRSMGRPFATMMLMPETRCAELDLARQVRTTLARVIIAAQRYRLATGAWPGTLGEAAAGVFDTPPVDPFDGAPMRYVVHDRGVSVYSVGADRTDDGGARPVHRDRTKPYDLVVSIGGDPPQPATDVPAP
ncbi:MAG: hypothetical protein GC159_14845 [Phycisphaera sp.]|nr:hypothetical protein [Phycisphaera sp.]